MSQNNNTKNMLLNDDNYKQYNNNINYECNPLVDEHMSYSSNSYLNYSKSLKNYSSINNDNKSHNSEFNYNNFIDNISKNIKINNENYNNSIFKVDKDIKKFNNQNNNTVFKNENIKQFIIVKHPIGNKKNFNRNIYSYKLKEIKLDKQINNKVIYKN